MTRLRLTVAMLAVALPALLVGNSGAGAIDAWECDFGPATAVVASPAASASVDPVGFPAEGGEVTVFAAASLTSAFGEIKAVLEAANHGLTITYNFGGSQSLVTQLTEGAPADVVALASNAAMDDAIEAGVLSSNPRTFAGNKLAVVVPVDNPAGIRSAADLARDGIKLVLAAEEVPAGQYARESICLMGADPAAYGDEFVSGVAGNVVSEEENVRAVLAKVELGEADAGIVYASDAGADVTVFEIPDEVNVLASYPIAPVMEGNAELAAGFIAYLLSGDGQEILAKYGFLPVDDVD